MPKALAAAAARANRLALIRTICASAEPPTRPFGRPVHNFFATATVGRAGDCCVGKNAGATRDRAPACRKIKIGDGAETHISSAFPHNAKIYSTTGVNKKILRGASRAPSWRVLPEASGGGAYTQN